MSAQYGIFTILILLIILISSTYASLGDVIWKYRNQSQSITAKPTTSNNVVFVPQSAAGLVALDIYTGSKKWGISGWIEDGLSIKYGRLYFHDSDQDAMVAVCASNGTQIWKYGVESQGFQIPFVYTFQGINWVYAPCSNRYLYALNGSNGNLMWQCNVNGNELTIPCVNPLDTLVCLGSGVSGHQGGNAFYAIKLNTGRIIWTNSLLSYIQDPCWSPTNNAVFITTKLNGFFCFNGKTGATLWSKNLGRIITSSPAYGERKFYNGCSDSCLYAFGEDTGNIVWKYKTNGMITCTPCYKDGVVYFGSYDGFLYALQGSNGAVLWKYTAGNYEIKASPWVDYGIVFIIIDQYTYAIETYGCVGFKDATSTTSKPFPYSLKAYPNPFRNSLNLELPSSSSVYLQTGQLIKTFPKGRQEVDTRGWKAGVYIVRCGKEMKRVVKVE